MGKISPERRGQRTEPGGAEGNISGTDGKNRVHRRTGHWKNRAEGESKKQKVPVKPKLENFMRKKNKYQVNQMQQKVEQRTEKHPSHLAIKKSP